MPTTWPGLTSGQGSAAALAQSLLTDAPPSAPGSRPMRTKSPATIVAMRCARVGARGSDRSRSARMGVVAVEPDGSVTERRIELSAVRPQARCRRPCRTRSAARVRVLSLVLLVGVVLDGFEHLGVVGPLQVLSAWTVDGSHARSLFVSASSPEAAHAGPAYGPASRVEGRGRPRPSRIVGLPGVRRRGCRSSRGSVPSSRLGHCLDNARRGSGHHRELHGADDRGDVPFISFFLVRIGWCGAGRAPSR